MMRNIGNAARAALWGGVLQFRTSMRSIERCYVHESIATSSSSKSLMKPPA